MSECVEHSLPPQMVLLQSCCCILWSVRCVCACVCVQQLYAVLVMYLTDSSVTL